MTSRRLWYGVLGVVLVSGLTGCGANRRGASGGEVPGRIVIGATLPLTGAEARVGGLFKQGYQLAFELAKSSGAVRVGKRKVPVQLKLLDERNGTRTPVASTASCSKPHTEPAY